MAFAVAAISSISVFACASLSGAPSREDTMTFCSTLHKQTSYKSTSCQGRRNNEWETGATEAGRVYHSAEATIASRASINACIKKQLNGSTAIGAKVAGQIMKRLLAKRI